MDESKTKRETREIAAPYFKADDPKPMNRKQRRAAAARAREAKATTRKKQ